MAERVATLSNTQLVKTFGVAPRSHKVILFRFLKILWVQICHKIIQKVLRFSKILQEHLFPNSLRLAMSLGKEDLIVERSLWNNQSFAKIVVKNYKRTCFLIPLLSFSKASNTFPEVWNTLEEFEVLSVLGLSSSRRLL